MTANDNVPGSIGLLDEDLAPIGNRQPCEYGWHVSQGTWAVRLNTGHKFSPAAGGFLLGIYDDKDRMIWALPIIGRPLEGGELLVEQAP